MDRVNSGFLWTRLWILGFREIQKTLFNRLRNKCHLRNSARHYTTNSRTILTGVCVCVCLQSHSVSTTLGYRSKRILNVCLCICVCMHFPKRQHLYNMYVCMHVYMFNTYVRKSVPLFNLLAPELFFLILAHPVYKMWIIQEPNKLELWNELHFEEKKRRVYTVFKIFSTYICWINI